MRVLMLVSLAGCIEGPEEDSVYNIEPRTCETGIAADQSFVLTGDYSLERQNSLATDPPRFALDTPSGVIELDTTVGPYGVVTAVPREPLPADADIMLQLVSPGALGGVYMPPLFPVRYSTRSTTSIRTYRSIDGNVFVSFSQPLDAATVEGAVHVARGTTPISATVQYLDAPGHVVHVRVADQAPLEIGFLTSLKTKTGAPVFDTFATLTVDPTYTSYLYGAGRERLRARRIVL
jgi:hypothetical protein